MTPRCVLQRRCRHVCEQLRMSGEESFLNGLAVFAHRSEIDGSILLRADGVVRGVATRGSSKEAPLLTTHLLTTLLTTPPFVDLMEGPGPDHPRRVAEGHWYLDFRIIHIELCTLG